MAKPLPPSSTIGIVGGGQLGRMLALAAAKLGLKTHVFCPETNAPAAQVATHTHIADYDDTDALNDFAAQVDVVTYEFENIPVETVAHLHKTKPVFPSIKALEVAQDRWVEKSFMRDLGLGVADFFDIASLEDLTAALAATNGTGVLKTRRFGYDGKGQWRLDAASDLAAIMAELDDQPAILESLVPFEREVSLLVARSMDGQTASYEPIENVHKNHILHTSTLPARLTEAQETHAYAMATKIANALDYVGVLAIECFVTDDALLVNEIAPRVHNSGHLTQDACHCGQFEQHMRAVAGWPLGDPTAHSDAVMTNLLGTDADDWQKWAMQAATYVHFYGKADAKPDRKMAHITQLSPKS